MQKTEKKERRGRGKDLTSSHSLLYTALSRNEEPSLLCLFSFAREMSMEQSKKVPSFHPSAWVSLSLFLSLSFFSLLHFERILGSRSLSSCFALRAAEGFEAREGRGKIGRKLAGPKVGVRKVGCETGKVSEAQISQARWKRVQLSPRPEAARRGPLEASDFKISRQKGACMIFFESRTLPRSCVVSQVAR